MAVPGSHPEPVSGQAAAVAEADGGVEGGTVLGHAVPIRCVKIHGLYLAGRHARQIVRPTEIPGAGGVWSPGPIELAASLTIHSVSTLAGPARVERALMV